MGMNFILTDHAIQRFKDRGIPDPNTVNAKRATTKTIKENNFHRKLKPNKIAYTYNEDYDFYLYICIDDVHGSGRMVVLTAYVYENNYNKTGNRKIK